MPYNSKSKHIIHNIKSSVMLLVKTWERGQPKTVIHSVIITVKWVHTRALLQSVFIFSARLRLRWCFFASAWRWRDCQRAVRWGVACIGCQLEASVRCFPSRSCSHSLPSVDSQAMFSVRWRQHKFAASAESAIGLNMLSISSKQLWYRKEYNSRLEKMKRRLQYCASLQGAVCRCTILGPLGRYGRCIVKGYPSWDVWRCLETLVALFVQAKFMYKGNSCLRWTSIMAMDLHGHYL